MERLAYGVRCIETQRQWRIKHVANPRRIPTYVEAPRRIVWRGDELGLSVSCSRNKSAKLGLEDRAEGFGVEREGDGMVLDVSTR